jgi:hypothetical protein
MDGCASLLPPTEMPQQLVPLLCSSSSSVVGQRMLFRAQLGRAPSTTRESVPNVSEALRPTASVSGMSRWSRLSSDGCGGCGGCGAAEASEGSLKGSSSPEVKAMMIANTERAS